MDTGSIYTVRCYNKSAWCMQCLQCMVNLFMTRGVHPCRHTTLHANITFFSIKWKSDSPAPGHDSLPTPSLLCSLWRIRLENWPGWKPAKAVSSETSSPFQHNHTSAFCSHQAEIAGAQGVNEGEISTCVSGATLLSFKTTVHAEQFAQYAFLGVVPN